MRQWRHTVEGNKVNDMKKGMYDWLNSRSVFELFRFLYFTDVNSVKGFEELLLKDKSAISHQLKALEEKGLIEGKVKGRDKTFKVNKKVLLKTVGSKAIKRIEEVMPVCKNFEDVIGRLDYKLPTENITVDLIHPTIRSYIHKTGPSAFNYVVRLEKEIERLRKENKQLKENK